MNVEDGLPGIAGKPFLKVSMRSLLAVFVLGCRRWRNRRPAAARARLQTHRNP